MPEINIALDLFGIVITLIIFLGCLDEHLKKEVKSNSFLLLMVCVLVALIGDVFSWIGEGNPNLAIMTVAGNTAAGCFAYAAILAFMINMKKNLYGRSKAASTVVIVFGVLCAATVAILTLNAFHGFAFAVNKSGHYVHVNEQWSLIMYLEFPLLAFITVILMAFMAKDVGTKSKMIYSVYAAFPMVGAIIDYAIRGWSLAYIGLVVSTVIIYTNIYLQKRRLIETQRVSLMMSQINPHFMYNTLNTIASLCDTNPKSAKNLIVEFSTYLRRNLDTLATTDLIPFEQELRHVECYLKIEKARFLDRVNVIYSIQCKNFDLPALTIQPIVENAIKHGITKKPGGGTVKVSTYATDHTYVIEIKDDGVGFDTEEKLTTTDTHIGLSNVRSRLKDMCRGTLDIKSKKGIGTRVTIEIPKKKGE